MLLTAVAGFGGVVELVYKLVDWLIVELLNNHIFHHYRHLKYTVGISSLIKCRLHRMGDRW